jgi:dephospho-CoA kinase
MSLHIGITGGIGAGKSTVCKIFQSLGIPVFDADTVAKSAYSYSAIKSQIEFEFGDEIFVNGNIDTQTMGKIVFSDPSKLKRLESIIHPYVHQKWMEFEATNSQAPYILRESALLISSGSYVHCDHVILVRAKKETRIARVQKRSSLSQSEIEKRMALQTSDDEATSICHFVIDNNDNDSVIKQVLEIHRTLTQSPHGIHKSILKT